MNKPDVSIIIPVYNDEEYIRECLESAQNQTLSNIEIVCVDDGSTDGTAVILRDFEEKDSRFVVIQHEKNMGTLMARKSGVKAASGEYIIFLDGDDYLAPDCCETAYGLICQKNVDIFWFSAEMQEYSGDGTIVRNDFHPRPEVIHTVITNPITLISAGDRSTLTILWAKIYHSQLVKTAHNAMDDFYCVYGEDLYEIFFLLHYAKSIAGAITNPLMFYQRGNGISGNTVSDLPFYRNVCGMSSLSRRIRAFLERKSMWEDNQDFWKQYSLRMAVDCCIEFRRLRQEDYSEAKKMLKDAWKETLPLEEVLWELSEEYARQEHWSRELERAKAWLLTQIESKDARIKEFEAWTAELEQAKSWLEEHSKSEETARHAAEEALQKQKDWAAELEQAKSWLEEHSKSEETARHAAEEALQKQKEQTEALEEAKTRLEQDKARLSAKLKQLTDDKLIQFIIKRKHYQI